LNKKTLIFMAGSYGAMSLGIFLPQLGEPMRHFLTVGLLIQLLLCFLTTLEPGTVKKSGQLSGLPRFMLIKMILTPLLCWGIFAVFSPRYALGAILLGGVSVGVTAPFFGRLARADVNFIIAGVVTSCLLLPLTMPFLVAAYLYVSGQEAAGDIWMTFLRTGASLLVYIFLPFIAAKGLWNKAPFLAAGILKRGYVISASAIALCMFVIFSLYSAPLLANPFMVMEATVGACILAVTFLGLGILAGSREKTARNVACMISMGTANNGLMIIISAQLFGLPEVLLCAMYSLPLFLLLIPYQLFASWREKRETI
jgi:BASS family bile acid:Na+ symporter